MGRHPSGYPVADDAPAFVAPALELRRAVEAARGGDVEGAVAFTLAFPIVERRRGQLDAETTAPDAAPVFHDADDTAVDMPAVDVRGPHSIDPESTLERDYYKDSGEDTFNQGEREELLGSLRSIGPFDNQPDLDHERAPSARVLLGRARAMRFRIALNEIWPDDITSYFPPVVDDALDLAVHPAIVVALADGMPADPETGLGPHDEAIVEALVDDVRARFPDVRRSTFRDTCAAAFARVTLLGTSRAADYLRARFATAPFHAKRSALTLGARLALGSREHHPRAIALRLLRDAFR